MFKVIVFLAVFLVTGTAYAENTKVRIGMFPVISFAQMFIAQEKGWDKEEGLDLELIRFSSTAVINALASDDIDGVSMATVGFIAAQSRGVNISIVAALSHNVNHMIARGRMSELTKEHAFKDALVKFKEETGRRAVLATYPKGSLAAILLDDWMSINLPDNEKWLDVKYLGPDQLIQGLLARHTDLAIAIEPIITIVREKDHSVRFVIKAKELSKDHIAGALGLRRSFVTEHPEETKKLVRLVYRATKLMKEDPKQTAKLLENALYRDLQSLEIIESAVISAQSEFISDPHVFIAPSQRLYEKLLKHGTITKVVDVPAMFNTKFHDEVVAETKDK